MDDKGLKVLLHASAFFSAFYISMLVPLVIMLTTKDSHMKRLSIQALLFQLVMSILITVGWVLTGTLILAIVGIPMLIVFGLMSIIVPIIGIVKALQDEHWEYPIVKRFF